MNKLTFKIGDLKNKSMVGLIKEIDKIPCRIKFDVENGVITVEDNNNDIIDTVIDLIDSYYTLLGVDIDNTVRNDINESDQGNETELIRTDIQIKEKATLDTINADPIEVPEKDGVFTETENLEITTKKISIEEALLEVIGNAFNELNYSKEVEEQINDFLTYIGMSTDERMVTKSFIIAFDIKKINYENVVIELHKLYPEVNKDCIKASLKENFKNWLKRHPELAEKCPKISIISIIKLFVKKSAYEIID